MGSNSDVSAFFRLRFRNGLGTKPAGVLPFRMRVPNTFFLSLAWWLAGFQVLRCAKVCFAWGDFFSLFLVGSKSNVSAVFWLRWASTQKGWSIPETCQPSPNHCFDRPHPTLLSPLLGVGGMGGSPSINYLETCCPSNGRTETIADGSDHWSPYSTASRKNAWPQYNLEVSSKVGYFRPFGLKSATVTCSIIKIISWNLLYVEYLEDGCFNSSLHLPASWLNMPHVWSTRIGLWDRLSWSTDCPSRIESS